MLNYEREGERELGLTGIEFAENSRKLAEERKSRGEKKEREVFQNLTNKLKEVV